MMKSTEEIIERLATPTRSYLPMVGRFLLVSSFIEDALRIVLQWKLQTEFIAEYRGFSLFLSNLLLSFFGLGMLTFSLLIVFKRHVFAAAIGLCSIIVAQALTYGLLGEFEFIMRNISIIGGLLMLIAEDSSYQQKKIRQERGVWAGLPSIMSYSKDKATWLSLFGRVLLVSLVIAIVFSGEMSAFRAICGSLGILISVLVVIGFKAKLSAIFLMAMLSVFNIAINNWWAVTDHSHLRDFLKFDFFQTLSVIGGLVLLISTGPGYFSIDEKKKSY